MKIVFGGIVELHSRRIAGKTDCAIDTFARPISNFDISGSCFGVRYIAFDQIDCIAVSGFQSLFEGAGASLVFAIANNYLCAFAGKQRSRGAAKSACSACDQNDAAFKRTIIEIEFEIAAYDRFLQFK